MDTRRIGSLTVSAVGLGCNNFGGRLDAAATREVVRAALDAGVTFFDTADVYGGTHSEEFLGRALDDLLGARRRDVVVATKFGSRIDDARQGARPEYVRRAAEDSLRRLGADVIDLYQLHRPDLLMDPHEIAGAFDALHRAGKVRWFGVSNFSPSFVGALQAHVGVPLVVNQIEAHLGRLDPFTDGTLDQCIERNLTPLAWSPLGGGWLGAGREPKLSDANYAHRKVLVDLLDATARDLGVSRTVVALAWLMKHPSKVVPIVGSANVDNIRDAARADEVELTREQWYRLLVAARGKALP